MQRSPAQPPHLRCRYQAVQEQKQRNGFTSSSTDISLDGPDGLELSLHLPKEPNRTVGQNHLQTQSDYSQVTGSNLFRRLLHCQGCPQHLKVGTYKPILGDIVTVGVREKQRDAEMLAGIDASFWLRSNWTSSSPGTSTRRSPRPTSIVHLN